MEKQTLVKKLAPYGNIKLNEVEYVTEDEVAEWLDKTKQHTDHPSINIVEGITNFINSRINQRIIELNDLCVTCEKVDVCLTRAQMAETAMKIKRRFTVNFVQCSNYLKKKKDE